MAVRRFLSVLLGLLAILVLAAILWAPFLSLFPGAKVEAFGGVARFRLLGAGVFVAVLLVRFLIRPPRKPSRRSILWGEYASATGGTVTEELRRFGPMGWTGGTTVRWNCRGVPVTLSTSTSTDRDRNQFTQLVAEVRLARGFQFHIVRESLIAKVFFSTQLWNVALKAVKEKEGEASMGMGGVSSAAVADRLAFMADKEILIGEPKFDDAFFVKSDTPALAREFFNDAGVSSSLYAIGGSFKGWQLTLMSRGPAGDYQLTLSLPGAMLKSQGLDLSRQLLEASIRCFADRGMLAASKSRAA